MSNPANSRQKFLLRDIARLCEYLADTPAFSDVGKQTEQLQQAALLNKYSALMSANEAAQFNALMQSIYTFSLNATLDPKI